MYISTHFSCYLAFGHKFNKKKLKNLIQDESKSMKNLKKKYHNLSANVQYNQSNYSNIDCLKLFHPLS